MYYSNTGYYNKIRWGSYNLASKIDNLMYFYLPMNIYSHKWLLLQPTQEIWNQNTIILRNVIPTVRVEIIYVEGSQYHN
jgi:hypothetical protein